MFRCFGAALLCFSAINGFSAIHAIGSEPILVTADYTPIGATIGGLTIGTTQWIGVRFVLSKSVHVEEVGGRLTGVPRNGTTEIFAGILDLSSRSSFPPNGSPPADPLNPQAGPLSYGVSEGDFIAHATFSVPTSTTDIVQPIDAYLDPGAYLLVFGSGLFGVAGSAAAPTNNPALTFIGDRVTAGYQYQPLPGGGYGDGPWTWSVGSNSPGTNVRFYLNGVTVPTPSTSLLMTLAVMTSVGRVRRDERV